MEYCRRKILGTTFILLCFSLFAIGQDGPKTTTLEELKNSTPPTAAEVMRGRIEAAKANLVVKNYQAAIYDLENIRLETADPMVHRVLNVLLMHAYLEQGEYPKAQKFLKELNKDLAKPEDYFAVAGQVISGARTQIARYESLGVSTTGASLPKNAQEDLDNMRKTLELVIEQSREIGKRKSLAPIAATVVEESSSARSSLARDTFDKKRWDDQVAEAREQIVSPRTRVINAMVQTPVPQEVTLVAQQVEKKPEPVAIEGPSLQPVVDKQPGADIEKIASPAKPVPAKIEKIVEKKPEIIAEGRPTDRGVRIIRSSEKKPTDPEVKKTEQPNVKSTDQVADSKTNNETKESDESTGTGDDSPMTIGSLISYASKRVNPVYPRQARSMRMTGTVMVNVIVDEDGRVATVESASGPTLLKRAAQDAIRKWKFKPFERDGQPVRASGYISFNFNL